MNVVESPAGVFVAADEFGAQRFGGAVEEVGAQLGPAVGRLVDQVPAQGVEVTAEAVLVGAEQQGKVVAGIAVPVAVDAGVPGVGGSGDEGTGGQEFSKDVRMVDGCPRTSGAAAHGVGAGYCRRHGGAARRQRALARALCWAERRRVGW
ncbi:hypothetical protein [Streptomyces sp. T028]|uniref:hypothetical protein n=1 Tax=Streptomyces sp. T028 TaxID=3394379 RepID=UPI003A899685